MITPVFYAPPEHCSDSEIHLPADESRHAGSVLRLGRGDQVVVVDGLGTAYRGELAEPGGKKQRAVVRVHNTVRNFGEPLVRLTLAAGLSAGSKFDAVVQRGTELGVKRFVPVITEKSKVKIDDPKRGAARICRFEKVALAAMKQCRRAYRPDIAAPLDFDSFLSEVDPDGANLLFQPSDSAVSFDRIQFDAVPARIVVLVGPEAGFSTGEVARAIQAGFSPVSLGDRILRTETAGPVVCALVMNALGELR